MKRMSHVHHGAVETPVAARTESRALAKGLQILEEMALLRSPASLGQLAALVGLGKASAFRLLQTLAATGYVAQQEDQSYVLNRAWTPALTQDWLRKLIAVARPEMEALNADLSETVTLAVLMEDHIRVVETIESPHNVRVSNYRDRILAPYASSLGKAIAAYQPPERLQTLLQVYGVYATTENTIVDPALIRQEMAKTRARGYAFEREETVRGGCCFGAPIFTEGDAVSAAMSVSLPTVRLTAALEEVIPQMLCAAAKRVSECLGGRLQE
jgi:DNA-binding IclR family transcriptional regulator